MPGEQVEGAFLWWSPSDSCSAAATPKGITDIKKKTGLDVLAMLKKSSKVFYEYGDQQLDLKEIYALNRKRPGRAKYLLSVEANLIQKDKGQVVSRLPVRIVFVRNRNKRKDWIALISTDMEIPEEEIIRRVRVGRNEPQEGVGRNEPIIVGRR